MWNKEKGRGKSRLRRGFRRKLGRRRLALESLESRNYLAGNTLSGFVYVDHDRDGVRDTGEPGVPGVQISLSGTDGSGMPLSRTMLTNSSGSYEFDELPSGTYQISERQPTALSDGMEATSVPGAATANDRISMIVLGTDQSFTGNNFGETSVLPRYVNIIWHFASSLSSQGLFRETVARAEELAGNTELAAAIRAGDTPPEENTPPVATSDSYSVNEDQVLSVNAAAGVLANDTDADGDMLTAELVTPPSHGSLNLNPDGSFTYTPEANFAGTDTFRYRASDGEDDSAPVDVAISVAPVEDPPAIVLPAEFTDPEDVAERTVGQTIDFTVVVQDPDDSDYVFQLDLEASGIPDGQAMPTIDPNTGRFLWTPTATGRFEIRVIVVNGEGEADQETFPIDIVPA